MLTTGSLTIPKALEKALKFTLEQWFLTGVRENSGDPRKAMVPLSGKKMRIWTSFLYYRRFSSCNLDSKLGTLSLNDR